MIKTFIGEGEEWNRLRSDIAAACLALSMIMSSFSGKMRGKLRLKSWEAVRTGERWDWKGFDWAGDPL